MRDKHKKVKHDDPQVGEKGYIIPCFIEKNKLTINTRPEDNTEIFIPLENNTRRKKSMLSFDMITMCSDLKDALSVEGKGVKSYQDFVPFAVK